MGKIYKLSSCIHLRVIHGDRAEFGTVSQPRLEDYILWEEEED
jgi:hypothetical protein